MSQLTIIDDQLLIVKKQTQEIERTLREVFHSVFDRIEIYLNILRESGVEVIGPEFGYHEFTWAEDRFYLVLYQAVSGKIYTYSVKWKWSSGVLYLFPSRDCRNGSELYLNIQVNNREPAIPIEQEWGDQYIRRFIRDSLEECEVDSRQYKLDQQLLSKLGVTSQERWLFNLGVQQINSFLQEFNTSGNDLCLVGPQATTVDDPDVSYCVIWVYAPNPKFHLYLHIKRDEFGLVRVMFRIPVIDNEGIRTYYDVDVEDSITQLRAVFISLAMNIQMAKKGYYE